MMKKYNIIHLSVTECNMQCQILCCWVGLDVGALMDYCTGVSGPGAQEVRGPRGMGSPGLHLQNVTKRNTNNYLETQNDYKDAK